MTMSTSLAAAVAAAHIAGPWVFGWWFVLIPFFWITVFVILFLVFGRRWRRRSDPSRQAEATLGERYAKGDIDEAEYRARLEVLRTNAAN
jgi:putative membrane protein